METTSEMATLTWTTTELTTVMILVQMEKQIGSQPQGVIGMEMGARMMKTQISTMTESRMSTDHCIRGERGNGTHNSVDDRDADGCYDVNDSMMTATG